ncbi:MAG: hypothetical protein CR965_02375 [Paludibacter sp.]|nr:MAG: hypothetical protein CR965_02375 [Paludibacter sp.]
MMNKNYLTLAFVAVIVLLLAACNKEDMSYDLEQSIFIEDEDLPGLPIYSEWGYNTFGALIDRVPFVSERVAIPSKVIVKSDTLNFWLKGTYRGDNTILIISFPNFNLTSHENLLEFNGKNFDLTDTTKCLLTLKRGTQKQKLRILDGNFHFKKVQKLLVDKEFIKVILSGEFKFKTFLNEEPVAINYGRFDLGIGYDNFFNLGGF